MLLDVNDTYKQTKRQNCQTLKLNEAIRGRTSFATVGREKHPKPHTPDTYEGYVDATLPPGLEQPQNPMTMLPAFESPQKDQAKSPKIRPRICPFLMLCCIRTEASPSLSTRHFKKATQNVCIPK